MIQIGGVALIDGLIPSLEERFASISLSLSLAQTHTHTNKWDRLIVAERNES